MNVAARVSVFQRFLVRNGWRALLSTEQSHACRCTPDTVLTAVRKCLRIATHLHRTTGTTACRSWSSMLKSSNTQCIDNRRSELSVVPVQFHLEATAVKSRLAVGAWRPLPHLLPPPDSLLMEFLRHSLRSYRLVCFSNCSECTSTFWRSA